MNSTNPRPRSRPTRHRITRSLILTLTLLIFQNPPALSRAANPTPHRAAKDIIADMEAPHAAIALWPAYATFDPRYRDQMTRELSDPLRRMADLYAELAAADPRYKTQTRTEHCMYLALLSLYGHDDATKTLDDLSHSPLPADAIFGQVGQMIVQWCKPADAATQKQELDRFAQLAQQNPKDDVLCAALLTLARYDSASEDLSKSARALVLQKLTGPAALHYKARPDKIASPYNLVGSPINGKTINTASWKGKVVIIDFWATWCPPCMQALPKLIQLYQDNHAKGLEILGVSNDNDLPTLRTFLSQHKDMPWPQLYGPSGPTHWNAITERLGVEEIPTTYLIDRQGILRDIELGLREDVLQQLLDEPAPPPAAVPKSSAAPAP